MRGLPIVNLVFEWVLPIAGGCLTAFVLQSLGLRSFWWILLILPGALAFQWTTLLVLLGVGKLLNAPKMPLHFRTDRTAPGNLKLIATGECEWDEFPRRAQAVADHFGMTVLEKIDGLDERLWIARIGESQFCISWDTWCPEVSIMAWKDTPDSAVELLIARP